MRPLGFQIDFAAYPQLNEWFAAMRQDALFLDDARRTARFMKTIGTTSEFERSKIFWRGDRIEWLLARGFHPWFFNEIEAGRVLWPD